MSITISIKSPQKNDLDFSMYQEIESLKQAWADRDKDKMPPVFLAMPIDLPEYTEYVKNLVTGDYSAKGNFLIVSAADAPMPSLHETFDLMALIDLSDAPSHSGPMAIELLPMPKIEIHETIPVPKHKRPDYQKHNFAGKHPMLRR